MTNSTGCTPSRVRARGSTETYYLDHATST